MITNILVFIVGVIIGLASMRIIAEGKYQDNYTKGCVDTANNYEDLLEKNGLKKEGRWVK